MRIYLAGVPIAIERESTTRLYSSRLISYFFVGEGGLEHKSFQVVFCRFCQILTEKGNQ